MFYAYILLKIISHKAGLEYQETRTVLIMFIFQKNTKRGVNDVSVLGRGAALLSGWLKCHTARSRSNGLIFQYRTSNIN